ncbi:MAG: ABC transporter ATP-binding protein [Acidobacteriota bacterium]|nr:ABC transporter ATP-binding protein [Acidobacteriota bacterium]
MQPSRPESRAQLRWALGYVRPYWRPLALVLGLSLLGTSSSLVLPYLSKGLVDGALLGGDLSILLKTLGGFAALTLLGFVLNVVSGLRYTRTSAEILFDMRLDLYRHLQGLSPRFYARTPLGEILSRLNNDIGEIQRVVADTALGWLGNVVYLVGTVAILAWLDLRLFALSLVVLPPALMALVRYRRRLEGAVATMRERSAGIGTFLIETLRGMKLVVGANAQGREAERFRGRNDGFIDALMAMRRLTYLAGGLPGLLLSLGLLAVFLYGGWRVIGGELTMGTLVAFTAYQMRLLSPVQGLMGLYSNLAVAKVSLGRVHEILDVDPEVVEVSDPSRLAEPSGRVVLRDVAFGFGRGGEVLEGVSFVVEAGGRVAVVGPSGCGKSTIADLLVRQLDPDGGTIELDGHDLRGLRIADVRSAVAVVDHAPFVFNASLGENIRYSCADADDRQVEEVVERAGLGQLVAQLPDGLDTPVGEEGQQLSAGERQRLAIARALLAEPAVLVLDEATATIDPATEEQLLEGATSLFEGCSVVVITHRLELAQRCDTAVLLERGRIAAIGEPRTLMEQDGPFRRHFLDRAGVAGL